MNLINALITGAAMETGRQVARRSNGVGFLQSSGEGGGDDWGWWDWDYGFDWFRDGNGGGGGFWDQFGADGDWVGWGGGGLPYVDTPNPFGYFPTAGIPGGSPYDLQAEYLYNQIFNPWAIDYGYGFAPSPTGGGGNSSGWDWDSFWDWIKDTLAPSPTPNTDWPFQNPNDFSPDTPLPGYCPRGTYHPQNDPFACVPFPNDPAGKKQAQQQRQQQQRQAQQARRAQQQQDKKCPKDPQGRPVWRNPQTGKCELVPQCPPGAKFDSLTKRCLTAAQAKEVYGDDSNLWLWLLAGGAVLLIATRDRGGRRR